MDEWKVVLAAMADVKRDAPLQLMQRVMTLDMALKALGAAWNRRAEQQAERIKSLEMAVAQNDQTARH